MTEPTPPCLVELRALKARIDARIAGTAVQSYGNKGRNLGFAEVSVDSMIAYYRQLWAQCEAAQAELPNLQPLDQPVGTRGAPGRRYGRHWV